MMKYYTSYVEVYRNGKLIDTGRKGKILTEKTLKSEEEIILTWDNLEKIYYNLGSLLPFSYFNSKKGRRISFFAIDPFNKNTWDIKEWKEKLKLEIKIINKESDPTIRDLEIFGVEKVKKYLLERT